MQIATGGVQRALTSLTAILEDRQPRTAHEHDVIAQALNDTFLDRHQDHPVRYSAQIGDALDGS